MNRQLELFFFIAFAILGAADPAFAIRDTRDESEPSHVGNTVTDAVNLCYYVNAFAHVGEEMFPNRFATQSIKPAVEIQLKSIVQTCHSNPPAVSGAGMQVNMETIGRVFDQIYAVVEVERVRESQLVDARVEANIAAATHRRYVITAEISVATLLVLVVFAGLCWQRAGNKCRELRHQNDELLDSNLELRKILKEHIQAAVGPPT